MGIVAPKVSGAKLADGSMLAADGQLVGTHSVLFDEVAVILSDEGAKALSMESAVIDFVRDAFGHLKAIGVDRRPSAFENNECRTRRGRHGYQPQRRIYCCGKDTPMGPGKVCANIGVTDKGIQFMNRDRTWSNN